MRYLIFDCGLTRRAYHASEKELRLLFAKDRKLEAHLEKHPHSVLSCFADPKPDNIRRFFRKLAFHQLWIVEKPETSFEKSDILESYLSGLPHS